MTGLSMRTLFEAHEQTILVAEGIANIRGSRASIMTAGDPLAMIFQKLTRRRFRFGDALLAKINAAEVQMKADAERMAELGQLATKAIDLYEGAVRGMISLIPSDRVAVSHQDALEAELETMRAVISACVGAES